MQGQGYHYFQGYASQAGICLLPPALHLLVLRFCCCFVAKACPTLGDPMDWGLPGFSVHGIFQARILLWVAISFSRGSSNPGIETVSLASPALASRFFTTEPPGKPYSEFRDCFFCCCCCSSSCLQSPGLSENSPLTIPDTPLPL